MNTIKQSLITIIICVVLLAGVNLIYAAWSGPPYGGVCSDPPCPPGGNAPAPINVSSVAQQKTGSLRVGGFTTDYATNLATISGNVGIGTTNPGAKLQISATEASALDNEYTTHPFEIWGTDQMLDIGVNTTERVAYFQSVDVGTAVSNIALNPRGGNVGIGTASPSEKLDVAGFIKTSQGIKFPDGTQQTSATIERSRKFTPITISNNVHREVNWYNICPANYYLVDCGFSVAGLPGWKTEEFETGVSYFIVYNSEIVGYSSAVKSYLGVTDTSINGEGTMGSCIIDYDCTNNKCLNPPSNPTLEADCIKVK